MTYNEFIQNIIDTRGQWNIPEGEYWEGHHIIPICKGGKGNSKKKDSNIIWLYPREHFIAHKLLAEENPEDNQLNWAYICMSMICESKNQKRIITPEEYEELAVLRSNLRKGTVHSEESKNLMSKNRKNLTSGENHPMYGKHHSEETKEKISNTLINNCSQKGKNNGFYGKHHSEETKKILSEKSGHPMSAENKIKMSERMAGDNNPAKDIKIREKNSKITKEKWKDPEYREKHINGMKGTKRIFKKSICPICNKEISLVNLNRHIESCRKKNNIHG